MDRFYNSNLQKFFKNPYHLQPHDLLSNPYHLLHGIWQQLLIFSLISNLPACVPAWGLHKASYFSKEQIWLLHKSLRWDSTACRINTNAFMWPIGPGKIWSLLEYLICFEKCFTISFFFISSSKTEMYQLSPYSQSLVQWLVHNEWSWSILLIQLMLFL